MDSILSIVRNIALLVLISSFWEVLAPGGKLRGMVRLIIGLLLISLIIMPLSNGIDFDFSLENYYQEANLDLDSTFEQGQAILDDINSDSMLIYAQDIEQQASSLVLMDTQILAAIVKADLDDQGQLQGLTIELELVAEANHNQIMQKIAGLMYNFFGLTDAQLNFIMR